MKFFFLISKVLLDDHKKLNKVLIIASINQVLAKCHAPCSALLDYLNLHLNHVSWNHYDLQAQMTE